MELSPTEEKQFLADLAESKLGTRVTADEATKITQLAKAAQEAKSEPTPNMSGVSDDYLLAADKLRSYVSSLKPTSVLNSLGRNAAIIARNDLLMNPATPLKTSLSQFFNSAIDMLTRRIGSLTVKGDVTDLAREANKQAWATFRKTGLNTASMENLDDTGKLGEGDRFEPNVGMDSSNIAVRGIETVVRKAAQITNKIAIDWEHNYSFTKFYQKAFFDSANIIATKLATKGDIPAADIFKDAMRIEPKTDEGAIVRNMAQEQAARVTSTNETWAGMLALGIKDALNGNFKIGGLGVPKVGLGDALIPIAKIPATIVANGIDNAGVGIPLGMIDVVKGLRKIGTTDDMLVKQEGLAQFTKGFQRVARVTGILAASAYFTSQLGKQDFKSDQYGDTFVKIAGTWVNLEYISAISHALAGMMAVKKNAKSGQSVEDTGAQYVSGVTSAFSKIPGISDYNDVVKSLQNTSFAKGIGKYFTQQATARVYPAFIKQLMSPQPVKGLFFSTTGLPTDAELGKLGAK